MVQIKTERLLKKYCPICGTQMQVWGAVKHKMALCISKDCNNLVPFEKALKLEDTEKGKQIYKTGYGNGYEDGFEVAKCQGSEIEEGFLEEVEE